MNEGFDCDVLVVGLGPVGDVLAGLLKTQGLSVIAIDREADIFPLPRAAAFDQEIMRIFQMIGAAEAIAPLCRVPATYQFQTAGGEVLLDFPVPDGPGKWGWAATYLLHQPGVERALRGRLGAIGVDVRTGTAFTTLAQDEDGVTVTVIGADGAYDIRARYVVGCDGAWSPVREAFGTPLFDYGFDEPWLVIDAIVKDGDDLPQIAMQICDPARPTTFLRMSGDRYRWEFMLKPGEDPTEIASDASIAALLAPWDVVHRIEIERRATYRFHALVAERWRDGRILIAGDAAHQMPPFAGQGMCSGIRDAANLAWKLAAVMRGDADEALLDTFQAEREPHVRAIIETAIEMGRTVCVLDPDAAAARDAAMLARKASGAQDVTTDYPPLAGGCLTDTPGAGMLFVQPLADAQRLDDVLGAGAWLIGRDLPPVRSVRAVALDDPALAAFAPEIDAWREAYGAAAVLVRPDRHVFGTGDAATLVRQWHDALGMDVAGLRSAA